MRIILLIFLLSLNTYAENNNIHRPYLVGGYEEHPVRIDNISVSRSNNANTEINITIKGTIKNECSGNIETTIKREDTKITIIPTTKQALGSKCPAKNPINFLHNINLGVLPENQYNLHIFTTQGFQKKILDLRNFSDIKKNNTSFTTSNKNGMRK